MNTSKDKKEDSAQANEQKLTAGSLFDYLAAAREENAMIDEVETGKIAKKDLELNEEPKSSFAILRAIFSISLRDARYLFIVSFE